MRCNFEVPAVPFGSKIIMLLLGAGHGEVRVGEGGADKRHRCAVRGLDPQFSMAVVRLVLRCSDTGSFCDALKLV